jgi:dynein heavy chain 1
LSNISVSFLADTGLKASTEQVSKYNLLMKEFPINELLSAPDIARIGESLVQIFQHFNKKLRLSPYPVARALPLVEAISRDFNDQILKVLGSKRLLYVSYTEFEQTIDGCDKVFSVWDEQVCNIRFLYTRSTSLPISLETLPGNGVRNSSVLFLPSDISVIKIVNAHAKLQERLSFIRAFRKQHEQLYNTIVKVSKNDSTNGSTAVQDVLMAFESVKSINVLDLTAEGNEIWIAAENSYNDRVSRVENQIIATLRDRLGAAKNANEMFRVFSKFNSLFIRPKIRGAIQEYQNQLIESVKDDIKKLHDKFKLTYRSTASSKMGRVRDLPPVSGAIIWARQIERQLGTYMKRVVCI